MTVPGQSGDKKHRFLSVPEAFLHKCKCLFQLPSDLFRTGLSLLRHFRKQLPDPFKASLCFCDMLLSHTARRSFATNAYKAGVPLSSIQAITGHSSEAQLRRYLKLDAEEKAVIALKDFEGIIEM